MSDVLIRDAGFRVALVRDMDSWLRRHAVFVTAIAGALYCVERRCEPTSIGLTTGGERRIRAVREGWAALDRRDVAPAPLALRAIFRWVPLPFASAYWRRLLRSRRGELYFALHTRHAPLETGRPRLLLTSVRSSQMTPRPSCVSCTVRSTKLPQDQRTDAPSRDRARSLQDFCRARGAV